MENKKTCADCINLGREVYCMKCKRLKNGYKDLFVDAAPSAPLFYLGFSLYNRLLFASFLR